jgi:hypothetical protein
MVCSARRGELLSVMYKRVPLPDFELLSATYGLEGQTRRDEVKAVASIDLTVYIMPCSMDPECYRSAVSPGRSIS